jgi:hypothetical protein
MRLVVATMLTAITLTTGMPARAEHLCKVQVLGDVKELKDEVLDGEIVRPPALERCSLEPDYVSYTPSATYFSRVHLSGRVCKYQSDRFGEWDTTYVARKGDECPVQSRYVYTKTYGVSDDEFLALDAFWAALVDHGTLDVDAMVARFGLKGGERDHAREFIEGARVSLRKLGPHIHAVFSVTDLSEYPLTDAEKANRFYYLEVDDLWNFTVMATHHGLEVIHVGQIVQ